jgi:hypothetical protein
MKINWPLITVLFCLSIPGSIIAINRLIYFLLPNSTEHLKKRISLFAMLQTLMIVLILCISGAVLSKSTGLGAPVLEALLEGKAGVAILLPSLLPALFYSLIALLVFWVLYYKLAHKIIDKQSLSIMKKMRLTLGLDGCILYGGVVEEVIARWGLMNLAAFFALIFMKQLTPSTIWLSIFISSLIFSVGQLPAYIAAGCTPNRWFIYSFIVLGLCQSAFFGYLFWQYGLICSMMAHMFFHLGWGLYDFKEPP